MLFLHGAGGLFWDPLLDALAATTASSPRSTRAPASRRASSTSRTSGTSCSTTTSCSTRSASSRATLVGHSFGGMVAAEIAADNPERVDKLVLIAPLGLWRDDHPVPDISGDAAGVAARAAARRSRRARWRRCCRPPIRPTPTRCSGPPMTMASILQFIWPLPDKGLSKRLYRLKAPTLLVWGAQDASSTRPTATTSPPPSPTPASRSIEAPVTSRSWSRPRRRSG